MDFTFFLESTSTPCNQMDNCIVSGLCTPLVNEEGQDKEVMMLTKEQCTQEKENRFMTSPLVDGLVVPPSLLAKVPPLGLVNKDSLPKASFRVIESTESTDIRKKILNDEIYIFGLNDDDALDDRLMLQVVATLSWPLERIKLLTILVNAVAAPCPLQEARRGWDSGLGWTVAL